PTRTRRALHSFPTRRSSDLASVLRWRFSAPRAKSLLSRSWPLLLSSIGSIIYLKIDQVMLEHLAGSVEVGIYAVAARMSEVWYLDRKSTRLNSSHVKISYAV